MSAREEMQARVLVSVKETGVSALDEDLQNRLPERKMEQVDETWQPASSNYLQSQNHDCSPASLNELPPEDEHGGSNYEVEYRDERILPSHCS